MSNLCTSSCCGNTVRLSDLRGKPIEFRQSGPWCPALGTRWDCPDCHTAYFAMWKTYDSQLADKQFSAMVNGRVTKVGCFVIDLSYYDSFNDEQVYDEQMRDQILTGEQEPYHLCKGDAPKNQWVW